MFARRVIIVQLFVNDVFVSCDGIVVGLGYQEWGWGRGIYYLLIYFVVLECSGILGRINCY